VHNSYVIDNTRAVNFTPTTVAMICNIYHCLRKQKLFKKLSHKTTMTTTHLINPQPRHRGWAGTRNIYSLYSPSRSL